MNRKIKNGKRGDLMEVTGQEYAELYSLGVANV